MLGYQDNAQKIFPFIPLVQSIITQIALKKFKIKVFELNRWGPSQFLDF